MKASFSCWLYSRFGAPDDLLSARILRTVASKSGVEETARADGADGRLKEASFRAESAD